ncbi:MAG: tetratricopeptide repeat protein [Pirellulaceae bacterium]|nr:tetratricopeptide repeat protein [Pirellulaceae bacterium]
MSASTFFRGLAVWLCLSAPAAVLAAAETTPAMTVETAEDVYAVAVSHYSGGRWQMAADEFTRFLRQYPDHSQAASALFFRAEALVQQGQHAEARKGYLDFIEREPDHRFAPQARFRAAEAVYLGGNAKAARTELEEFVANHPGSELSVYAQKYLAELALAARDGPRAAALFKEILERHPDGPQVDECRFGLGRALELQGDIESARIAYQTMTAANGPLADDAQVQTGICLYNRGDYPQAAKAFQTALERFPDSDLAGQARYWLGMCQVAQQDWDKASETLRSALDSHPQHALAPSMTFWLADTMRQRGDLKAAQEGYAKVVQSWPQCEWADDSLEMLIQFALTASQFDRVVSLGEQFRAEYPASPRKDPVAQRLGRGYLKQKEYAKAIEILKPLTPTAAVGDRPAEADGAGEAPALDTAPAPEADLQTNQYYLGLAYLGDQQYEAALEALAHVPTTPDNQELSGGVRLAQAMAYAGLNRHADAIEPLQQYLAAQPPGPEAAACRVHLINSLVQSGCVDEALKMHGEVAGLPTPPPGFEAATLRLAEAAYEAGKYDDSVALFEILIEDRQPAEWASQGWSGLGWTQFRAGKAEAAVVAFTRLFDQYPESPLAAEGALMKAKALEQLDRSAEALEAYLLVVTTYADSEHAAPAMLEAARLQETLGKKAEAIPLLRRLIQAYPEFKQLDAALYQLAWLLEEQGQAGEAGRLFERISEQYPGGIYWADTTYRLAERASRAGQYDRAKQFAERLTEAECDPDILMHALYLRGQVAAFTQRWPEVAISLTALLEQFPESPLRATAECWIAEALYQQKDYAAASQWFARLEQEQLAEEDTWTAMIPLRRAQILAEQQQWRDAYELASGIEERFPDFGKQYEADYVLGLCLSKQGKPTEALPHYERVIRSPEGGRTETAAKAQWMIGEAYAALCEWEQALKAYYRVESLYSYPQWQAAALVQAGKCHERQGDEQSAALVWRQVVSRFAKTPYAAEAAQRLERLNAKSAAPAPKVVAPAPKVTAPAPRVTAPTPSVAKPPRKVAARTPQDAAPSANVPAVHFRDAPPFKAAVPARKTSAPRIGNAPPPPPIAAPPPLPTEPQQRTAAHHFRTLTETKPLR